MVAQGISPVYATAAVGHLIEESGGFDPRVISGERRGDSGTAAYIAQWRGERLANLEAFARSQGRPLDLDTQIDFLIHEGRSGLDAGAARWYKQAVEGRGNLADATAAFAHFERPQGYTSNNPYGIATFEKRLNHANSVAGAFGSADPSVMGTNMAPVGQPSNPGLVTPNFGGGEPVYGLDPFTPIQGGAAANPNTNTPAGVAQASMPPLAAFDWTSHRSGGGLREDAISGLDQGFRTGLERMIAEAPDFIRQGISVGSGYRSEERQAQLWEEALRKYGSPEAARKWVAPPGRSNHNHGKAADLNYNGQRLDKAPAEVREWFHQNAARYGMAFPLDNEAWHIEPIGARGGSQGNGNTASLAPEGGMPSSAPFGIAGQGGSSPEGPSYTGLPTPTGDPNGMTAGLYGRDLFNPLNIDYGTYGIETPNLNSTASDVASDMDFGFDPYNINTFSQGTA